MMMLTNTMIPGDWITTFAVAVIPAVAAAALAWKKGQASGQNKIKLEDPVPEVPVKRTYSPPSFYQHQDLARRVASLETDHKDHREYVEAQLRDIRREQSEQFVKMMNAGELRKDTIMEMMRDMFSEVYLRINQIQK